MLEECVSSLGSRPVALEKQLSLGLGLGLVVVVVASGSQHASEQVAEAA